MGIPCIMSVPCEILMYGAAHTPTAEIVNYPCAGQQSIQQHDGLFWLESSSQHIQDF